MKKVSNEEELKTMEIDKEFASLGSGEKKCLVLCEEEKHRLINN